MAIPHLQILFAVVAVAIPLGMLFVVPRNRTPTSAIAWLLLIALLPVVGLLVYLVLGTPKLPRARRQRQREMDELVAERLRAARQDPEAAPYVSPALPERATQVAALAEHLGGMPALGGNTIDITGEYDDAVRWITEEVRGARSSVHLEYYILALDAATEPLIVALEQAARRGVKARVLFDHLGSRKYRRHQELLKRLDAAGIEWQRSLPVLPFDGQYARPDLRNHRKIVVVDGRTGFIGSQNIIRRSYHSKSLRFVELVGRIRGPAVAALDAVFAADWYAETGELVEPADPAIAAPMDVRGNSICQVLPSGSGHPHENNLRAFLAILYGARERIVLVNPYFVPDAALLIAITSAVQRGVDVRLITNEVGDSRFLSLAQASYYGALLGAGVTIFLYPHPTVLHSKTITVDDDIAVLGSSNLDIRSLYLNLEVSLLCYDPNVVATIRRVEEEYERACRQLSPSEWSARPRARRVLEGLARLTSALQ